MMKIITVLIIFSYTLLFSQPEIEMNLKLSDDLQIELEFSNPDSCTYLIPIDCWYTSIQFDENYELLTLFDNHSLVNQLVFLKKNESGIITPKVYNFSTAFIYGQEIPDFVKLSCKDTFKVFIDCQGIDPNLLYSNDIIRYYGIFCKYSNIKYLYSDQNYISDRIVSLDRIHLKLTANTLEHLELVDQPSIQYPGVSYSDKFESFHSEVNIE